MMKNKKNKNIVDVDDICVVNIDDEEEERKKERAAKSVFGIIFSFEYPRQLLWIYYHHHNCVVSLRKLSASMIVMTREKENKTKKKGRSKQ